MRRIFCILLLAFSCLAGAVWLGRNRLLKPAAEFLVVEDPLEPADLIHVLGGGSERVDFALQLYRKGFAMRLLFTGNSPDGSHSAPFFHRSANRALREGVAPEAILDLRSRAESTYGEAWELRQLLKSHPEIHRVLVVTSPWHSRRASMIMAHFVRGMVDVRMATVPVRESPGRLESRKYRSFRSDVQSEYKKLLLHLIVTQFRVLARFCG